MLEWLIDQEFTINDIEYLKQTNIATLKFIDILENIIEKYDNSKNSNFSPEQVETQNN